MKLRAYCRIPKKKSVKAKEGGCPELLYDLLSELDGASKIHIATYLFNNPVYFDFLSSLAEQGCIVKITSLPILGYSDKPSKVEGFEEKISGRQMAKEIYHKIRRIKNMELKIFPHLYVWYGALYAGGGASYSFHIKAILAKFRNGIKKCILSSGNFMFTDSYHSDNLIVIEGGHEYESAFKKFFADLDSLSVPYGVFCNDFKEYKDEFLFSLHGKEINLDGNKFKNCFFTAPFYLYDNIGSNHYAGNRIIELINGAHERIWVCAQHFHDLVSFDNKRETIIDAFYRKFLSDPSIEFRFLKQVSHSSLADKRRAAIAETLFQFVMKVEQRYNRLAHVKFMIFDNTLLVSTANYTSTQFAFGKRQMDFKNGENKSRKIDNFSETNGFVVINNFPEVVKEYETHFNTLWEGGESIEIKL